MILPETLRAAFVIARRDFVATVFRKTFLLFLIGPLIPVAMGLLFGGIGARMATDAARPVIAVVATPGDFAPLARAHQRLSAVPGSSPLDLLRVDPAPDAAAQRKALLARQSPPVIAVLEGGLDHPRLSGAVAEDGRSVGHLTHIIDDARRARATPGLGDGAAIAVTATARSDGNMASDRQNTGRVGQLILFFLTILLAGAVLSQLVEEKTSKVIEILAAAVPIDSIFIGKLFAMLAISGVGIAVWTVTGALGISALSANGLASLPEPAVGWPLFMMLAVTYFAMAYLLIGAVFLGVGSQAGSVREIQTLNMPIVLGQSAIYFFATTAIGHLDEPGGLVGAIFPLSSPLVMIARAAEQPTLWTHLAALAWQALWVVIILRLASAMFRRNVLKSGRPLRWPWQRRRGST